MLLILTINFVKHRASFITLARGHSMTLHRDSLATTTVAISCDSGSVVNLEMVILNAAAILTTPRDALESKRFPEV